jgi:hypothetical protein
MSADGAVKTGAKQAGGQGRSGNSAPLAEVPFAELVRARQVSPLPVPLAGGSTLPLGDLDPEVLERLAAEMIKRRLNDGSQFYGRRGQKQYGLDIVEQENGGRIVVYQVRRYAALTPAKITRAVTEYAGRPSPPGVPKPARRFAAGKYVLLTSGLFEDDTALGDRLAELRESYKGDLVIDVWGREKVSSELRDCNNLVKSVFGGGWAREFCGFAPPPLPPRAPNRLGLVDDPVAVLEGLGALAADAQAMEGAAPLEAARLYGLIAGTLQEANFPAHAAAQRVRQGHLLKDNGDFSGAFAVLSELAMGHIQSGETTRAGSVHFALGELRPALDSVQAARLDAIQAAQDWYEQGSRLSSAVPALETLHAAADPQAPLLTCLILEQALADGWYDFDPPALLVDPGGNDRGLLSRLLTCADALHGTDPVLRARLHCACADARLNFASVPADVEAAFARIMWDTVTGRYREAEGLAAARAARAFAMHGDIGRAIDLWRKSIMLASESRLYGDILACRMAINTAALEKRDPGFGELGLSGPLPNEDRLLAAAHPAQLQALAAVHAGDYPGAFGAARRCLWESRTAGHLRDERAAMELFGDIMLATGRPESAVAAWVMAGSADKAGEHAPACSDRLDMSPFVVSPARHCQAAAARVIGAQASLYTGGALEDAVHSLIGLAGGLWNSLRLAPNPALDAVNALCRFGRRIPASAVDPVLELLGPALAPGQTLQPETVSLLIQAYWAVPARRGDLAAVIATQLSRANPPPGLWGYVRSLPVQAREPMAEMVTQLASAGNSEAVQVLAAWQVPVPAVQAAARRAIADTLRQPPPVLAGTWFLSTAYTDTAVLAAAMVGAGPGVEADPRDLRPGTGSALLGRTLGTMTLVVPGQPGAVPAGEAPAGTVPLAGRPVEDPLDWEPDQAAVIAAGPHRQAITALASHFLAIAESGSVPAFARTDALCAIRVLASRLAAETVRETAARLADISENPNLNEFDQAEIASQDPLSRGKLNTGAGQLSALALLTAAEVATSCGASADPGMARLLAVRAALLLRSPDRDVASCAAAALARVAGIEFAAALVTHPLDRVREIAAAIAPLDDAAEQMLAADPAPKVRAALATRSNRPSPGVLQTLLADPHPDVADAAVRAAAAYDGMTSTTR